MNSEGENTPPDPPDPRVNDVVSSLSTKRATRNAALVSASRQDVDDRRVTHAFDVVVPSQRHHQLDGHAHPEHAHDVPQVVPPGDGLLEEVLGPVEDADERRPRRAPSRLREGRTPAAPRR